MLVTFYLESLQLGKAAGGPDKARRLPARGHKRVLDELLPKAKKGPAEPSDSAGRESPYFLLIYLGAFNISAVFCTVVLSVL